MSGCKIRRICFSRREEDLLFLCFGRGSPLPRPVPSSFLPDEPTETTKAKIEEAFKKFTSREDVAVLLIQQNVRPLLTLAVSFLSLTLPPGC